LFVVIGKADVKDGHAWLLDIDFVLNKPTISTNGLLLKFFMLWPSVNFEQKSTFSDTCPQ